MHKFEECNSTWGNVGVYHLDELYNCNQQLYHSLLSHCMLLGQDTSSTFFIFLSPQFLINHRDTLDIFVSCAHERTLRVIAMDEVGAALQNSRHKKKTPLCSTYGKKIRRAGRDLNSSRTPPSPIVSQCRHNHNQPLWGRFCDVCTTSLRHWQHSRTGVLHACATASPKLRARNSSWRKTANARHNQLRQRWDFRSHLEKSPSCNK